MATRGALSFGASDEWGVCDAAGDGVGANTCDAAGDGVLGDGSRLLGVGDGEEGTAYDDPQTF